MTQNPYQAPSVDVTAPRTTMEPARFEELLRENKRLNSWSLLAGAPGLVMQALPSSAMKLVGTALLVVGLSFYLKMKGRGAAWSLLGLLSIIGFLAAALLPKYCRNCQTQQSKKVCSQCGGPVGI